MSTSVPDRDLIFLLADKNLEATILGLMERQAALGIRKVDFVVRVHPQNDPGCCLRAHDFLRPFCRRYLHSLVVFDHEGCGREKLQRARIEEDVETRLASAGWDEGRARAVVLEPELEAWVWSDSPVVDQVLGWVDRPGDVRSWLRDRDFELSQNGRPKRPKKAVEAALRNARKPRSSSLYRQLAAEVSLRRCVDPAFNKLKTTLQEWFPAA